MRRGVSPPPPSSLSLQLGGGHGRTTTATTTTTNVRGGGGGSLSTSLFGTPDSSSNKQRQQLQQQQHDDAILEAPITAFRELIETTTTPEDWQRRITALEALVESVPDGSAYLRSIDWYNRPKLLAHLAGPIGMLLKDARSGVVRRVCTCLTDLFTKCQTDGRHLFKDLMTTILDVHGQTVQVIRQAVQTMVLSVIPDVPCKSVMPTWMERLKDKSPAVREACSLYLGHALQHWDKITNQHNIHDDHNNNTGNNGSTSYLTDQVWHQIGNAILKTMRDPSPTVRKHAKAIIMYMHETYETTHFTRLLQDEQGPACQDTKLRQWLLNLGGGNTAGATNGPDELSAASKYTLRSEHSQRQPQQHFRNATAASTAFRISTPRKILRHSHSLDDEEDEYTQPHQHIPIPNSIHVSNTKKSGASPSKNLVQQQQQRRYTPPRPKPSSTTTTIPVAPPATTTSPQGQTYSQLAAAAAATQSRNGVANDPNDLSYSESTTTNLAEDDVIVGNGILASPSSPFIKSMQELKEHARERRSRHSIVLRERFRAVVEDSASSPLRHAASGASATMITSTSTTTKTTTTTTPEHVLIAIQLLRSHKSHVDQVMETLRIEMDVLRDFDNALTSEPGRPTELELLEYYERVDLCVEQRIASATAFRAVMERISRGEDEDHHQDRSP
jgi:hypothetical protein